MTKLLVSKAVNISIASQQLKGFEHMAKQTNVTNVNNTFKYKNTLRIRKKCLR